MEIKYLIESSPQLRNTGLECAFLMADVLDRFDLIDSSWLTPQQDAALKARVREVADSVPGFKGALIRDRYGLNDGRLKTLAELSAKYRLSLTQIQMVLNEGMQALRYHGRIKKLLDILDD